MKTIICILLSLFLISCTIFQPVKEPDIIKVRWINKGDAAVVIVDYADRQRQDEIYILECSRAQFKNEALPFDYDWLEDCDLDTVFNSRIQFWSNPNQPITEPEPLTKDRYQ